MTRRHQPRRLSIAGTGRHYFRLTSVLARVAQQRPSVSRILSVTKPVSRRPGSALISRPSPSKNSKTHLCPALSCELRDLNLALFS